MLLGAADSLEEANTFDNSVMQPLPVSVRDCVYLQQDFWWYIILIPIDMGRTN